MSDEQWMDLETVCNVEYGTRVVQKRDGGSVYPVYGGGGATFCMDSFNREDRLVVARFGMSEECTRFVAGRFFLNDSGLTVSVKNGSMTQRFLDYQMLALNDKIYALGKGTAQKNLDVSAFRALPLYVPKSLPEQQRIVALLDEAFAGLATAKANAEQNLQHTRALFESQLEAVFSQQGEEWMEANFEELIQNNVIGLTKARSDQGDGKTWPYVKMNNITSDNRFDPSQLTYVDATEEEASKYSLRDGDFLFNTRNSHELVGKSCIYKPASNATALFNNNIMRVRFRPGVDARFVLLAFSSRSVSDKLNALKSGTTNVSAIYFKDLKSLAIPIPSVETQKAITRKFEALSEETQHLTRIYERKLAALEELKKSLLQQAFNGEL